MIHQAIAALIKEGDPKLTCYLSVDHSIYNGLGIDKMLSSYAQASEKDFTAKPIQIFFDEIQYPRDWELHLKTGR